MSLASRLGGRAAPAAPAAPPDPAPTAPADGPPAGVPERRRRRRGALSRLLTGPFPAGAIEAKLHVVTRPLVRALAVTAPLLCIAGLVWALGDAWSRRVPVVTPRHRAEALCFALAAPPPFRPAMTVEPGAALVRGRFTAATPPGMAIREAMRLDERMVISERMRRVGDFEVATLWLRLPGPPGHWLVVGWMEGSDLALCSFRFAGDDLTSETRDWGDRLLARVLTPANFRAGSLPAVRLRAPRDGTLPAFGPATAGER